MKFIIIFSGLYFIFCVFSPAESLQYPGIACVPYVKKKIAGIFNLLTKDPSNLEPREETKFYLLTRKNPNCTQEVIMNDTIALKSSNFNKYWPTRIVIHGWMNNLYSRMNRLIKYAYLKKGNFNVIIVDWGSMAVDPNYNRASKRVDAVGKIVAEFTSFLHKAMDVSFNDMYLIGHSLGAQIAGAAGHFTPKKVNTIFALDPAEPNFKNPDLQSRLDISSARYVESIHTDMGLLGVSYPVGHASFYPNYGRSQRGCALLKACSHSRAWIYFAESINSDLGFWGIPCQSIDEINKRNCTQSGRMALMGGEPSAKKVGLYYMITNGMAFYARGRQTYWSF